MKEGGKTSRSDERVSRHARRSSSEEASAGALDSIHAPLREGSAAQGVLGRKAKVVNETLRVFHRIGSTASHQG